MSKYLVLFSLVAVICLVGARPVQAAYIDPNTGGMLFQVLAALFGVISGVIFLFSSRIRMGLYRIMRQIRQSKSESQVEDDQGE